MEAKIGQFFDSVGSFFTGGDQIPWCDSDIVSVSHYVPIIECMYMLEGYGDGGESI